MSFGSSTLLQCLTHSITTVVVDQKIIASKNDNVRNLGVEFDSQMNMRAHCEDGANVFLSSETSTPDPTVAGA